MSPALMPLPPNERRSRLPDIPSGAPPRFSCQSGRDRLLCAGTGRGLQSRRMDYSTDLIVNVQGNPVQTPSGEPIFDPVAHPTGVGFRSCPNPGPVMIYMKYLKRTHFAGRCSAPGISSNLLGLQLFAHSNAAKRTSPDTIWRTHFGERASLAVGQNPCGFDTLFVLGEH